VIVMVVLLVLAAEVQAAQDIQHILFLTVVEIVVLLKLPQLFGKEFHFGNSQRIEYWV
jgi:hypothetical protein